MVKSGLAGLLLVSLAACSPTVGTACDDRLATDVVYDSSGSPAYAGQSIFITSCASNGSFCHAESATRRYGAPYGMNFDPTLADGFSNEADGARHLYAAQLNTHHLRDDIYGQVTSGAMPPGAIGRSVQLPAYVHDDAQHTPVPDIRTADGREILRNWLACRSPVIEATMDPTPIPCTADSDCSLTHRCDVAHGECFGVGAIVPVLGGSVMPHWTSIYANIVAQRCTLGPCHSAAGAPGAGNLDLQTGGAAGAYAQLLPSHMSGQPGCNAMRIVAGHPETSLFSQTLTNAQPSGCGAQMPFTMPALPADEIMVIDTWITNGALMD
jgi:hypothetical protein